MTSAATKIPVLTTVSEFLATAGEGRHELVDGIIRAMSPASAIHSRLQARLGSLIDQHLSKSKSPCWVGTEPGVKPRVEANHNVRVPDLGVTCAPSTPDLQLMPDPVLLIEILSPGNVKDTRSNVWTYTTIPSVQEILVVHSTVVRVELLRRNANGSWPENPELIETGGAIKLTSIGASFLLSDIYAGTHLA